MIEESEESKSNVFSLKKSKKETSLFKTSQDNHVPEILKQKYFFTTSIINFSSYLPPEYYIPRDNAHLLLQYDNKLADFTNEGFSQTIEGYLRKMALNKKRKHCF